MNIILQDNNQYVLRFDRDEEVIGLLQNFCQDQNIKAAAFSGIGAVSAVTVSYYQLAEKIYQDNEIKKDLEVVSFDGNISTLDGEVIVHAHGSFADSKNKVVGGHVKSLTIAVTGEVLIQVFAGEIQRQHSEEIGLNLMV